MPRSSSRLPSEDERTMRVCGVRAKDPGAFPLSPSADGLASGPASSLNLFSASG